ncbi:hypothetical protein CYV26_05210 [Carnobacterium maltaromaticum]|uniref:LysM peptidoglycan-binding domain-containing protein n=1 Tax=Carnobacterium maltaromaticum TaxID=2751 RepID=UPI000C78B632|nr:LysM peptidoglycan-binding domain-containing protein [Carnobacterium maltaromaticum]PLS38123.1 hypothetical protein CYV33_02675 [Carnobacterium maltaromaticum]PLS38500.1 hypothetical protein CYV31_05200 [Carnobacterium maltaromaticum]PLS38877.1 hypothetical protein CYV30_02670 [Carnobacterium maltaromaticum]PLS45147.1 hypothetical protein CYV28_02670 [Carnobacterium maltaromaticum]PLS48003.1 hypothetical protein CYV27_00715 [Carnobacterium maltaromaticum]
MSKKRIDDQQKEEAWSRKFDDEGGFSEGNYSRTARKKAKGGISPILTTLCVFLALLIILPISVVWWYSNNKDVEDTGSANDQVTMNSSSSSKESSSSSSKESSSESKPVESSSAVSSSSAPVEETPAPVEPTPPVEETPPPVEEPPVTNTYTVKSGDNLYRIAVNNGMTLDQIKQLNGLSSDTVSVGQVLKIN